MPNREQRRFPASSPVIIPGYASSESSSSQSDLSLLVCGTDPIVTLPASPTMDHNISDAVSLLSKRAVSVSFKTYKSSRGSSSYAGDPDSRGSWVWRRCSLSSSSLQICCKFRRGTSRSRRYRGSWVGRRCSLSSSSSQICCKFSRGTSRCRRYRGSWVWRRGSLLSSSSQICCKFSRGTSRCRRYRGSWVGRCCSLSSSSSQICWKSSRGSSRCRRYRGSCKIWDAAHFWAALHISVASPSKEAVIAGDTEDPEFGDAAHCRAALHRPVVESMLGTLPKDFSQVAIPKGIFPSGNFPNVQFPKQQLPKSVLAAAIGPPPVLGIVLGPLAHPSCPARPPLQPAAPQKA